MGVNLMQVCCKVYKVHFSWEINNLEIYNSNLLYCIFGNEKQHICRYSTQY
jgi:hypothetical protein